MKCITLDTIQALMGNNRRKLLKKLGYTDDDVKDGISLWKALNDVPVLIRTLPEGVMTMKTQVTKIVHFDMAHQLTDSYSKECQKIHGHTYKLEVTFEGDLNAHGMVMDFKMIKQMLQPIIDEFDHEFITSASFGMNPTAENMCVYIYNTLKQKTRLIKKVRLWETPDSYAEVGF